MATPAGVSSNNTLVPEKSLGNENFDKLFESVSTLITTSQTIRDNTGKVASSLTTRTSSIDLNPTADKLASLTELNTVIPSGFLLLHNDLLKLTKDEGAPEETSFSLLGLMKSLLVVVGGAAIVGGIVKGLFSGSSEDDKNHLNTIISELNQRLSADDLADDPDVIAAQKAAFIGYLKAYYLQQEASMLVSGTLEAVGEGAGAAVRSFFTSLFGKKTEEDETPSKLDSLVTALIDDLDIDTLIEDPDVLDARKKGFLGYLKTYFITQATALTNETILASVGTGAGKLVGGVFSGIWEGLTGQDTQKSTLETIVDSLLSSDNISISDYMADPDIKAALFDGVKGYLKTYFVSQTAAMALESTTTSLGAAAAGSVVGVLNGLIDGVKGWFGVDTSSPLEKIVEGLIASIKLEDYVDNEEVLEVERKNVIAALKTYFATQTAAMALESTATAVGESVGDSIVGALSSLVSGVKGIFGAEEEKSPLETIIETLASDIDPADYEDDEGIEKIKREAVASAVRTYFQTQVNAIAMEETAAAAGSSVVEGGKSVVKGVWNWITGKDDSTPLEKAVASIVSQEIDVTKYQNSEEISAAKEKVLADSVLSILDIERKSIVSSYVGKTAYMPIDLTSFVAGIGNIISYNLTPALYEEEVKSAKHTAVKDIISKILTTENNFIASKYETNLDKSTVKSKLSSVSNAYLNFLTSTVSSGSFTSTSTAPTVDTNSQYVKDISDDVETTKGYILSIRNYLYEINNNVNKIKEHYNGTSSTTTVVRSGSSSGHGAQDPNINSF